MLAREYADLGGKSKPIILSHRILFAWIYIHMYLCIFNLISICSLSLNQQFYPLTSILDMLPGLKEGQAKMSKSDPSSAIFMEDDEVFPLIRYLPDCFESSDKNIMLSIMLTKHSCNQLQFQVKKLVRDYHTPFSLLFFSLGVCLIFCYQPGSTPAVKHKLLAGCSLL